MHAHDSDPDELAALAAARQKPATQLIPSRTVITLLRVLEERLPVADVAIEEMPIWPLIRVWLSALLRTQVQFGEGESLRAVVDAAEEAAASHPALWARPVQPTPVLLEPSPRTGLTLVLVREVDHLSKTPRGLRARLLDPRFEAARAEGPTLKVQLAPGAGGPKQHEPVLLAPPTRSPTLAPEDREALARFMRGVENQLDLIVGVRVQGLAQVLEQNVHDVLATRDRLLPLLQALRPAQMESVCWYSPSHLGAIWAARLAGVASVDVQHGLTGAWHASYSHWGGVSARATQLLPDRYLCWDQRSASHIAGWRKAGPSAPEVIVNGHPALQAETSVPLSSALAEAVESASKVALVTLQTVPQAGLTEELLARMKRAPNDWLWLVRCHPLAEPRGEVDLAPAGVEARLRHEGIARYEAREATAAPLGALLAVTDVHLTAWSSCVLEADMLGVPSELLDDEGRDQFEEARS